MNILVVDDEEIIVQGIVRHISRLEDLGAQVVGAYSAKEALSVMEYFRPHLLITDICMPERDGLSLIEEVEKHGLCPRCMILTAYERFEYAQRALDFHVIGYLVKPVNWEELDSRLRALDQELRGSQDAARTLDAYAHLIRHLEQPNLSATMKKVVRIIQKNYAKDFSLAQLSIRTGLSESYLCTLFKNEMDITYLDYVNELRLRQAMKELLESNRSVREVAALVGYRSERQLFRLFNNALNMTPQQFREANHEPG